MADYINPTKTNSTIATPYTSDAGAIQSNIDRLSSEVSMDTKNLPTVRQNAANEAIASDKLIPTLNEDKAGLIKQLAGIDTQIADSYANPQGSTYILNPTSREAYATKVTNALLDAINTLTSDVSTRRSLLGSEIDKQLESKKYDIQSKQLDIQALKDKLDRAQKQYREIDTGDKIMIYDQDWNLIKEFKKGKVGGSTNFDFTSLGKDNKSTTTKTADNSGVGVQDANDYFNKPTSNPWTNPAPSYVDPNKLKSYQSTNVPSLNLGSNTADQSASLNSILSKLKL